MWTVPKGKWAIIAFSQISDPSKQIDYLDPQAVRTFIDLTHEEYFKRFNENPNFAASWSFETAQALFEALKINTNIDELKDTILSIGIYNGLQGDLPLNEFGDVARRPFIIEIVNGDFVTLE